MKLKNLDSVIHNFAHSLQSYDYTHSSKIVFDILATAYCENGISYIIFDFVKNSIQPKSIQNEDSEQLLIDYLKWLPQLAKSQNTDASNIELLQVEILVDFNKHKHPPSMDYAVELELVTKVRYKIKGRDEQGITLSEVDIYGKKILPEKLKNELWKD